MPHCTLDHLRLHNFRNYAELEIDFDPGLNVITGSNAQGKTNLVEAIACMAVTRSPRATTLAEVMRWNTGECGVFGRISRHNGDHTLELRLTRESDDARVGRSTRVDGKPRHAREIIGLCPVVTFSPDDLQLIKAGPDGRRRRLNMILAQLDQRLATELVRYRRVVEQRNALLRAGQGGSTDLRSLDVFTEELIEYGARIRAARVALVTELSPMFQHTLTGMSGRLDTAELQYVGGAHDDVEQCNTELRRQLKAVREQELARGVTLAGPHRDDVEIVVNSHPARTTASQGQQRSLVLALALAEVLHIREVAGVPPLLLLDDVLSELDPQRRNHLLEQLAGEQSQVFVTTSEPHGLDQIRGRRFSVVDGHVVAMEIAA